VTAARITAGGYDVLVGRGALAGLAEVLHAACPAHRYAVIADAHVAELHGAALMAALGPHDAFLVTFPAGEWNKTREQWAALTDQLLASRLGRDGAVIAFGGGVAGDLGGFVAATYLRGIPVVQVPTSLLAMVDASVGGKTGVDVPAGKNLVGAFHPPRAVVADVDLLATLPKPQVASGLAEVVKHGVVLDAEHFAAVADPAPLLSRDPVALEPIVRRSVELKAAVVAEDPREAGRRAVLNFGHTVGHAVEALSGFGLLHGESVAIGMAVESRIAEAMGIAPRGLHATIVATLTRCRLPVTVPEDLATDDLLEVMVGDKKTRAGKTRLVLPQTIGVAASGADGSWTHVAEAEVIRAAIEASR
jgi:3-dehydroquinate synthase